MKRIVLWLTVGLVLLGAAAPGWAKLSWDDKEFMGVNELLPGMKGYGKTVFEGTKVEKFDIEVVGVLRKIDFGFDMILIRVTSGPVLDRKLQTVSGMSGSPIYIDGRLIGAYAYGWNFQQEPIAGVTPIAAMLEVTEPGSVTPPLVGSLTPQNGAVKIADRIITRVKVAATSREADAMQAKADATTMVLSPVSTPVFASGLPDAALKPLQKLFDRYNLLAMPGPGRAEGEAPPLEPGSAVAVSLMDGDVSLAPIGTVTYVKDGTVLAFGHPFLGRGAINMPMCAAYVHGIVNSAQSSFKMASPMQSVGTVYSDRQFAIAGQMGKTPDMLPVMLYSEDASRQFKARYQLSLIRDPELTPFILYLYAMAGGAAQLGDLQGAQGVFTAHTVISTDTLGDISQKMVYTPEAGGMPMGDFYLLANLLMQNPYEPVNINKVFIEMSYAPGRAVAAIEKVTPDRAVVRPGETVTLSVRIRPYGKPAETYPVKLTVPDTCAEPIMAAVITGGMNGNLLKGFTKAGPTPEEGVRGLVRWITDTQEAKSLLTAQLFPTPSYGYRGDVLRDIPLPVVDLLRFGELGGALGSEAIALPRSGGGPGGPGGAGGEDNWSRENLRPTTFLFTQKTPYVLTGGHVVLLAIQTDEQAVRSTNGGMGFGFEVPVLSSSRGNGDGPMSMGDEPSDDEELSTLTGLSFITAQQRQQYAWLRESLAAPRAIAPAFSLPRLTIKGARPALPLSVFRGDLAPRGNIDVTPMPEAKAPDESDESDDSGDGPSGDPVLLTAKDHAWGMKARGDFLHGKHLGTAVTSRGELVLAPNVSTVARISRLVPWKMVSTKTDTFVVGWGDPVVLKLVIKSNGFPLPFFPRKPEDVAGAVTNTALAADADGNLFVGSWPDQKVRMVKPDGTLARTWSLPGAVIWDLAVSTTGQRYAACDDGRVYELRDREDAPVRVVAAVPDKQVSVLAPGPNGTMYFATSPRGKVYRLNELGLLEAVFEGMGGVSSLLVGRDGTLFIGQSPQCRVIRVTPDGTQTTIMRADGSFENHVLALQIVGEDLYACTGPGGGIYRISGPTTIDPSVSVIYARQDRRDGVNERDVVGPESVMVNALTVTAKGELLAAASSPGQILRVETRKQGSFLSSVLHAPNVARWGQVESLTTAVDGQTVAIESRSGNTALPDRTWTPWAAIVGNGEALASTPAPYVQLRVRLASTTNLSPSLDYLKVHFEPTNRAPMVKLDEPANGSYVKGKCDISWVGRDPDADKLVYMVYATNDDGKTWTQLTTKFDEDDEKTKPEDKPKDAPKPADKPAVDTTAPKAGSLPDPPGTAKEPVKPADAPKADAKPTDVDVAEEGLDAEVDDPSDGLSDKETHTNSITWDTKTVADGTYRIKVVASDKYAKPLDAKSAEIISGRFVVDNTAPTVTIDEWVATWDAVATLTVQDNLTAIRGGRYRLDAGPWVSLVAVDGMFNTKQETIRLVSPDGPVALTAGNHKVSLQVKDAAGNALEKVINIGEKPATPPATPDPNVKPNPDPNVKPNPDPANTTPVKLPIGKTGPEDSTGLADLFFDTLKKN